MASPGSIETVEPVVLQYLKALEEAGIHLASVYLFGSFATGTSREWSDIDVAVVSDDFSGDPYEDGLRLMRLMWDVDVRIEPHPFRPEDFTSDNPWVAEIMRTGIKIV
jgi:predicted nucleotidyltransferase